MIIKHKNAAKTRCKTVCVYTLIKVAAYISIESGLKFVTCFIGKSLKKKTRI